MRRPKALKRVYELLKIKEEHIKLNDYNKGWKDALYWALYGKEWNASLKKKSDMK